MPYGLLKTIQAKAMGVVAIILAILAAIFRVKSLKGQRDRAERKADTLRATVHANRIKEKIKKEEDQKLVSRRAKIKEEIKKLEKGEDFEGVDNLTDPNDY